MICVGSEGEDIADADIERIDDAIRAVRNYIEDEPEDYQLWHGSVKNLAAGKDSE